MTYQEVLENARTCSGPFCKACPVCNGRACGSIMPGPGAKGVGDVAIRNYEAWQKIRINMNTIEENKEPDTTFRFFGKDLRIPVMAGPVGAVKLHYGDKYNDVQYNDILVPAAAKAGIIAFTGDGTDPNVVKAATAAIKANHGAGTLTRFRRSSAWSRSPDPLRLPWISMQQVFRSFRVLLLPQEARPPWSFTRLLRRLGSRLSSKAS